jgi:hypothetical protein
MKKLLIFIMLISGITFPILAQNEEVVESLILKKGNIPDPVLKSADQLFHGDTQVAWGSFPYELKDYGWHANTDYNEPIDHYEIQFKGKDGSDIWAVFESTGELIKCRIINRNAPVPKPIYASLEKSEYKDWKITGDIMLIKSTQKKIQEHYAVKLAKDNKQKTLYYDPKGELLSVK